MGHDSAAFAAFFEGAEPRLRQALCGAFGAEVGREAAADALTWAWQHWDRVQELDNPVGYLYRVGRSQALRAVRRSVSRAPAGPDAADAHHEHDYEPQLLDALAALPERQRVAVWLVHGLEHRHREVAEILGCSTPTVTTHVRRGLATLRRRLEAPVA
jgi:RNA polymerase sigma factor (sigma-70 family)